MGEVYKARDTRLDRTVAIKILPESLAADPQFRERFDREARAISQLTHPHICVLHDIGHQDGTDFLVLEYLEGETLAERLEKGPLPLDQALSLAIQIASALDNAHRAGSRTATSSRRTFSSSVGAGLQPRPRPSCSTSAWRSCADRPRQSRCRG